MGEDEWLKRKYPLGRLFRYRYTSYGSTSLLGKTKYDIRLICDSYKILKETRCGVWIEIDEYNVQEKKFVNLEARKQFASRTIELALENFYHRKKRHLKYTRQKVEELESVMVLLEERMKKVNEGIETVSTEY